MSSILKKSFLAAAAVVSCVGLSACGDKSGFVGDPEKAESIVPHYAVDPTTGLCFSEKGRVDSQAYSHTWVPCTDRVVAQLPEKVRPLADRTAGMPHP